MTNTFVKIFNWWMLKCWLSKNQIGIWWIWFWHLSILYIFIQIIFRMTSWWIAWILFIERGTLLFIFRCHIFKLFLIFYYLVIGCKYWLIFSSTMLFIKKKSTFLQRLCKLLCLFCIIIKFELLISTMSL